MQKMSEDQFQDWKDNSEFFFNHLQEKLDEVPGRMADIGYQLGNGNPEETPAIHKLATVIGSKADLLESIINIEHSDIFGGDDD